MKERIVIVAYKPKDGKSEELEKLVKEHYPVLKKEGLVTDRKPIIAKSSDGSIIEIFGWKSAESIAKAHENQIIQQLWENFSRVCEYVPISKICESENLFSEFQVLNG